MKLAHAILMTASGIVTSKDSYLLGVQIGTDGVNDPTITVYKGTAAVQGNELIPTATYDSAKEGIQGFVGPYLKGAPSGIYCEITCAGSVEVVLDVGFG